MTRLGRADRHNTAGGKQTARSGVWLLVAVAATLIVLVILLVSRVALAVIVIDGAVAAGILLAAAGLGLWLIVLLGLGRAELGWQLLAGCGLGVGALSLLVLGLGLVGWLEGELWIALLAVFALAGSARLISLLRKRRQQLSAERARWLWLIWVPAIACTLLVATRPPGLPWGEEAGAYDVLAYHLNVPKEYFLAGQISFLRHNVFSNMPLSAEMLYLLCMVLYDDPTEAVMAGQLCNAWLAVLAGGAGWLIARGFGRWPGIAAGLLAGTFGWLMFTSGVAYVENGLLLLGLLSAGALVRLWAEPPTARGPWAVLAGLCAGFACGFKYTALPMIALPVAGIVAVIAGTSRPRRWRLPAMTLLAMAIAFGPWLIKNCRMTGNPVFPLGYSVFGSRADVWNAELADQWHRATTATPDQQAAVNRLRDTAGRVVTDGRFSGLTLLLAVPILLSGRKRGLLDWLLAGWWVWQMLVWATSTHLLARFGATTIIPLIALAGRSCVAFDSRRWARAALASAAVIAAVNVAWSLQFAFRPFVADDWQWFGRTQARASVEPINMFTPRQARVLSVGYAATFYATRPVCYAAAMSPDAFAEQAAHADPDELIAWLQDRGFTHLLVHWGEIERLRQTYGYPKIISRELFARLQAAGLSEYHPDDGQHEPPDFIQVFRVPTK